MYQHASKGKTQSEKSKASTPATNKNRVQTSVKILVQAKSLFSFSNSLENGGEQKEERKQLELTPIKSNSTGIPTQMKERFENISGFSFDDVKVHYNSGKPAQLQALAYTQGNQVYVAPGQERHLGHELGHVVQQKQGLVRPTATVSGMPVNDNDRLEREADLLGNLSGTDYKSSGSSLLRNSGNAGGNVLQRQMTINITDGVNTRTGFSGDGSDTETKMNRWPQVKDLFKRNVTTEFIGGYTESYKRTWSMCAEPNAFATLVHECYAAPVAMNLANVHFTDRALDTDTNERKAPCKVCSKWVNGNLTLKNTIDPHNFYTSTYNSYAVELGFLPINNPTEDTCKPYVDAIEADGKKMHQKMKCIKTAFSRNAIKPTTYESYKAICDNQADFNNSNVNALVVRLNDELKSYTNDVDDAGFDCNFWYPALQILRSMKTHISFNPKIKKGQLLGKLERPVNKANEIKAYAAVGFDAGKVNISDYLLWYDKVKELELIYKMAELSSGKVNVDEHTFWHDKTNSLKVLHTNVFGGARKVTTKDYETWIGYFPNLAADLSRYKPHMLYDSAQTDITPATRVKLQLIREGRKITPRQIRRRTGAIKAQIKETELESEEPVDS